MPLSVEQREAVIDGILKSKPSHQIAREMGLSISEVIDVIQEYKSQFDERVRGSADLFDKKLEHVMKSLESYDKVKQEAWKMYETTDPENGNVRSKYLKIVMEVETKRDAILQLLGTDKDAAARLALAQATQISFINIVKQVVSGCPKCANALRQALAANRMSVVVTDHRPLNVSTVEQVSGE